MSFITDLINKITNFRVKVGDKLNTLKNQIGQLNSLTTNDKTSLVGAVNEVNRNIPTVNNGKLTLSTGTGLSGSATFTANQPGGSTFTVGIASTHVLPTTAQTTTWNNKQDAITGGATTIVSSNLTANRALISNASGKVAVSSTTSTELGYLSGVTSAIQTQLNDKINTSLIGANNGVASLDSNGLVLTTQLPSYVDDVIEASNLAALNALPSSEKQSGKIYVALDTNKTYRWSGSAFIYITSGAVDSVAGKTGVVTLVKGDVGLTNVDNTSDLSKPISTATQTELNKKINKPTINNTPDYVLLADGSTAPKNEFGNVKTVNGKSPDSTGNTDIGIDDTLRVDNITERIIEFEDGGITLDVIDEEGLEDKKFFAYSVREEGKFRIGTGCGSSKGGWSAATFFGWGSLIKLNRNNTTTKSTELSAYGYNSLKSFEGGDNGGITSIGANTLFNFVGTNDPQPAYSYFMTALGTNALYDFLDGSRNTALGGSSGRRLVTGSYNTFTGSASMQELKEGSNNTAIGCQVTSKLKKGSNNTFIGANLQLNEEEVNDTVIIADGTGKQHFKSDDKGSILPSQTIALIDADETGKAIITKEFVDSKISNFKLPTNWESPQQRFSGLVDKSSDATYTKTLMIDDNGFLGYKTSIAPGLVEINSTDGAIAYGLSHRVNNPNYYQPIGQYAIDLSYSEETSSSNGGATGKYSFAVGELAKSTGRSSMAIGSRSIASGDSSMAIGSLAKATRYGAIAIGNSTEAAADSSIAILGGKTYGMFSVAIGALSNTRVEQSVAIGYFTQTYSKYQVVIGANNLVKPINPSPWIYTDDIFVVGNGENISNRSNALELRKNGHLILPTVTNDMIDSEPKSVVTKAYLNPTTLINILSNSTPEQINQIKTLLGI